MAAVHVHATAPAAADKVGVHARFHAAPEDAMSPSPLPDFVPPTLPPADEPTPPDAERVERWVGFSATVVVMLAGMAALLV